MLEPFSAGYWIAPNIRVVTHSGNAAVIQDDLFYELVTLTGNDQIIGSTGGRHFSLRPQRSVPSDVVAIPDDGQYVTRDGDALLIAKQNGREAVCF